MYKRYTKRNPLVTTKKVGSFATGFKKFGGAVAKVVGEAVVDVLDLDGTSAKLRGVIHLLRKQDINFVLHITSKLIRDLVQRSIISGKFPAKYRTQDGHQVRSKAEVLIANWLFYNEISYTYERKLPVESDVYCDFYLPKSKVYIEYWGYENDPKYKARKTTKLGIYKDAGLNLIELTESEVMNLDDSLPGLLIKYGVKVN